MIDNDYNYYNITIIVGTYTIYRISFSVVMGKLFLLFIILY